MQFSTFSLSVDCFYFWAALVHVSLDALCVICRAQAPGLTVLCTPWQALLNQYICSIQLAGAWLEG
jgi:hypothetical protein